MPPVIEQARDAATRGSFQLLNSAVRPAVKAGLASPPPIGQGIIVLETTGRVSGQPREVPLLAVRVGDRLVVSTVLANSQWLQNLEANPRARVWSCGQPKEVTARVRRGSLNVAVLAPIAGRVRGVERALTKA